MKTYSELPNKGYHTTTGNMDHRVVGDYIIPFIKENGYLMTFVDKKPEWHYITNNAGEEVKVNLNQGRERVYFRFEDSDFFRTCDNGDVHFYPPINGMSWRTIQVNYKNKEYNYFFDKGDGWGSVSYYTATLDALKILGADVRRDILNSDYLGEWYIDMDFSVYPFLEWCGADIYRIVAHREALNTEWKRGTLIDKCTRKFKTENQKFNLTYKSVGRYALHKFDRYEIEEKIKKFKIKQRFKTI